MNETLAFVAAHGYWLVALWVALDQIGLPLPSSPILLAAGALAAQDHLDPWILVAVATLASYPSDLFLYELGRRRGMSFMRLLCRISLEPDACVRQAEVAFSRRGAAVLVWAKFLPGLTLAAPPLAGIFRMPLRTFLLYDGVGALLYASAFVGLGHVFHTQLEAAARWIANLAGGGVSTIAAALLAYWAYKALQRQRMIRLLRTRRITPRELWDRVQAGELPTIVDVRALVDFADVPKTLPGAHRIGMEEIEARHHELPRDRDLILYCT